MRKYLAKFASDCQQLLKIRQLSKLDLQGHIDRIVMDPSVRSLSRWVYLQLEMVRHIPNMSGGESAKSHQDKEIQNMHGFQNRISDKQTVLRLKLFF